MLPGLRRFIVHECIYLFRRGRQARKIKRRTPDQADTAGFRRKTEAIFLELGKQERVYWCPDPPRLTNFGYVRPDGLAERPELAILIRNRPDFSLVEGTISPCKLSTAFDP